jgi:hypothetical protein
VYRRSLIIRGIVIAVVVLAVGIWRYQGELIGTGARLTLERISAHEEDSGEITRRKAILANVHQRLLMTPPLDPVVPELFDYITLLSSRVATGEVTLNWAAYLYSGYARDLVRERPDGTPRRSPEEIRTLLDGEVAFFAIRKRPQAEGFNLSDLVGRDTDTFTLEEIEAAEREGREIDLR